MLVLLRDNSSANNKKMMYVCSVKRKPRIYSSMQAISCRCMIYVGILHAFVGTATARTRPSPFSSHSCYEFGSPSFSFNMNPLQFLFKQRRCYHIDLPRCKSLAMMYLLPFSLQSLPTYIVSESN